jgi:hypothetical protein
MPKRVKPKTKSSKQKTRGLAIKKLMKEKGLTLGQASHELKTRGK